MPETDPMVARYRLAVASVVMAARAIAQHDLPELVAELRRHGWKLRGRRLDAELADLRQTLEVALPLHKLGVYLERSVPKVDLR